LLEPTFVNDFGQITNRENPRDWIVTLDTHSHKNYHHGFGKSVTGSNLAKAYESREYHIKAMHLIPYESVAIKLSKVDMSFRNDFTLSSRLIHIL